MDPADSDVPLQNEQQPPPPRSSFLLSCRRKINMSVIRQDTFQEVKGVMRGRENIMSGVLITRRLLVNTIYVRMGVRAMA